MSRFAYIALDRSGRETTGIVPAENRAAALDEMMRQGLSPVSVQMEGGAAVVQPRRVGAKTRLSQASVEAFTRELANLLAAGLPLARSLQLLRREASNPAAKAAWSQVHDDVVGGMSLADALAKMPRGFSTVYVAMIRAGEAGGFLSLVLQQISDFRTRERDLKGKVKAAMIYPMVLGVFAIAVLIFLLTFFIPRFSGVFSELGGNLPWLTRVIVSVSQTVMSGYSVLLAAAIVGLVLWARWGMSRPGGRRVYERIILATPAVGRVNSRFALVRFSRMLGTLLGSGVPLVASLKVAKEAIGNQTLADAVSHAIDEVQRGASLGRSLANTPKLFPPSVVEMVMVAEETGRLDKELTRLAAAYENDLDRELRMLVSLVEPAMLFVMAAIIGTIVIGMLLPVFSLQELVH